VIDRQGRRILIECDSCDEVWTGDEGAPFSHVWEAARHEGWRARKVGDQWVHGCRRCGV
jgi:hypothetical protein